MKNKIIKKIFSLFLSVFLFVSQVVLGSAAETQFWKERNNKINSNSHGVAAGGHARMVGSAAVALKFLILTPIHCRL